MKKALILLIAGTIGIFSIIAYRYFTYEFSFHKGTLDSEIVSPGGDYTARVYHHYYGGAAGGVNVYVNVVSHQENDTEKTLYYSDAKTNLQVAWTDGDNLRVINKDRYSDRSITLTVGDEIYHESGKACNKYSTRKYVCYSKENNKSELESNAQDN